MKKKQVLSPAKFLVISLIIAFGFVFLALFFKTFLPESLTADLVGKVAEKVGKIETETPLPHGSVFDLITAAIRVILGLFSVLLTIVALWAGTLFVIHFGDEEKVTSARKLLIWALVGVAVSASAYAIVSGVIDFNLNPK